VHPERKILGTRNAYEKRAPPDVGMALPRMVNPALQTDRTVLSKNAV